jgi:GNAT superfamily N-acetyltransferase
MRDHGIHAQAAAAALATLGECLHEDRLAIHGKRFELRNLAPGATVMVRCYGSRAEISFVDVEPRFRQQGNARKAMQRILERCDALNGGVEIYLTVQPTPVLGEELSAIAGAGALQRFYASLGFVEFASDDEGRLIMRRPARARDDEAVA